MWYCIDYSNVEIMNDVTSTQSKFLEISFDIPSDMCDLDEDEIECVPHLGLNKQIIGKWALLLKNHQRFV